MEEAGEEKQTNSNSSQGFIPRARLELDKYFIVIVLIWGYSWLIPVAILYQYYNLLIQPDLHIYASVIQIFSSEKYILVFFLSPVVLIGLYLFRLFFVILFSKIAIWLCNLRSPMKELIASKGIGKEEARDINIYHLRGMILRILKWEISKSPFPWLVPAAFNFVNVSEIGKGTTLEDQFYTQEFLETGENAYIGQGSIVSSHLVEGKYGAITLKKVRIGQNAVLGPFNPISPGALIGDYAEFLPMSGVAKFQKVRGFSKYYGLPVARISTKRYIKMCQIPPELEFRVRDTKLLKRKVKKKKTEE
ncbi:hypothetical protein NEF87_002204 [Candidatus Lokiarchaeum ossiferum]|uniref:Acetyltransferase n=1 Tax=Candidatus Lokiarchaeum ossiferum TaxID=2951803 RepID=A0ABY6HTN8_9ARCH|nr:hypothetical protein NEF87_002204 [Candidatus Lokiarchaeum sp. B-35]